MRDEVVQRGQRLLARDGPGERLRFSRQLWKHALHGRKHRKRNFVGLKCDGRARPRTWTALSKWQAILLVKIPFATNRLGAFAAAFHEVTQLAALLAVEKFHGQRAAILGPGRELRRRCEKVIVRQHGQRNARGTCNALQHFQHAPLAGLHAHNFRWLERGYSARDFSFK